jgi:transcriptional regulator with PAS, ATPase and Fis domain
MDTLTIWARYPALPACPAAGTTAGSEEDQHSLLYLPSGAMGRLMKQVRLVAPQDTTLLLSGETGTGKTRLARLIHDLSTRREEPFLVVNCGALAGNLIESEMFGHIKGAFTGAERDRTGKFADVGRGTLLLDEIDALPLILQVKLLRAVEERVFEPVGSNKSAPVLARIIAASNRSLEQEVQAGRFRADLYYRLNVVSFSLPSLRERGTEIARMVPTFIREFAGRNGRLISGISEDAMQALQAYRWPGNIRELRNVIERAVALCPGTMIQLEDLPEATRFGPSGDASDPHHALLRNGSCSPLDQARWQAEVLQITEALERHCDNRLRAAADLGISRRTFYKKLHRYGLMQPKLVGRDVAHGPPRSDVNGL